MFWLIVLIILILIIHSMMKATTGVAKAVGKGVAHDMSQINAELTNKTTITNYLDYLVNCKGWKKSGTLLVIYEAPNGKNRLVYSVGTAHNGKSQSNRCAEQCGGGSILSDV